MALEARKIINSPFGLNLAYTIGKYTPLKLGHRIAFFAADLISARTDWKLVCAARTNQWVASGENLDNLALSALVNENFRNIAVSIFDYYHNINNPGESLRMIEPHPYAVQLVQRPEFSDRGLILAGVHMSNFDMAFQLGGLAGIKALVLTLTEFNAAYQKQWEMRSKSGLKFIMGSGESVRHAISYLRSGGLIITAVDRPDPASSYHPMFFNHPASLPIHHIFLALKAQVPIVIGALIKKPDEKYHMLFSDPIEMQPHPDRRTEIMLNAENILHVAEEFIRQDTKQWAMTFPVWPDITFHRNGMDD
jgi:lauroyl/myristoyl acyltransferase